MTRYLVAIHRPNGYDPAVEDEVVPCEIDALNDEMMAAVACRAPVEVRPFH